MNAWGHYYISQESHTKATVAHYIRKAPGNNDL